jgi:hypothetical protein
LFPFASIKNYGDVVFDNNKLEKNSVPGRVPDSLYRKAELTSNKLQKKLDSLAAIVPKQETFNVLEDLNSISSSPFLSKWEEYRISQLDKKVSRKETRKNDALSLFNSSIDDITEAKTSSKIIYDNRLLNLWDTKGLNLVNPLYGNDPVIQSYGGGPSSILGIGKTKIKFATLNDGVTPLRTGVNMADPYEQYGRRLVEYKTTNIFGKTFMPNSYGSVSLTYAEKMNFSVSETNLFGSVNYLEDYNNKSSIDLSNPDDPYSNSLSKFKTWSRRDFNIQSQPTTIDGETKEDFRKSLEINNSTNTFLSASPSYIDKNKKNIETRLNLGNPGQKGNISSYTNGKKNTLTGASLGPTDKVNASFIYKANTDDGSNYGKTGFDNLNDIIPFYIAILNNDSQKGGTYKKYMHFRSYIDSFSDSYDAEWNPIEYMGRAEKFYKYGGFNRKISMAFTIVAQSREEITAMYDKLNFLASSLAPEYLDSSTSGYMAGNIAYITLGGYLDDQPGVITSLTYDIPEESPWEIGIDDNGLPVSGSDVRQMPHMIKVTGINFIPIHKFRPEKQNFRNDKPGTTSTRLLNTGKQRYLDQLRPLSTNYDKDAQETYDVNVLKEQKIAVQTQYNEGILNTPTQPTSTVNDVVGNNGALVFGP